VNILPNKMKERCLLIFQVAYLVHFLSGSYCAISRDHLMPMTSRLGTLIAYDSVTDKDRIVKAKKDLEVEGLKVQKTIGQIIVESNKKFHVQVDNRSMQIESTFKKMIPPISEEKKEAIKVTVQVAVKKGASYSAMEDINLDEF
jgi:hypothetical protein